MEILLVLNGNYKEMSEAPPFRILHAHMIKQNMSQAHLSESALNLKSLEEDCGFRKLTIRTKSTSEVVSWASDESTTLELS